MSEKDDTTNDNRDLLAQNATSTVQGMTPQFTGPMTQFGSTVPNIPPPVQFQAPQQQQLSKPQGSFATVGERKRADRQAILQNTAQLVKSGADYIQQNKYRTLQMNIKNLMEYSQGIQEAQQVLNDPNSTPQQKQQAQQALISNIQNSNAIVHNTKNSKMLQNAYNVDLFGKSKDPKANAALNGALLEFQKKQAAGDQTALDPRAQRLMQSQPQRLQLSPQDQAMAQAIRDKLYPSADARLVAQTAQQQRMFEAAKAKMQFDTEIKRAEIIGGQLAGQGGTLIRDPSSSTGLSKMVMSKDGKRAEIVKDAVAPSLLPSTHTGTSFLAVEDPDNPGHQIVVEVPHNSTSQKVMPGGVGQGNGMAPSPMITQDTTKGPNAVKINKPTQQNQEDQDKAKKLGLPPGSRVIAPKALNASQVDKLQTDIASLEGTRDRLKDIRKYTDIYSNMFQAGKISFITNPQTGQRMLGSFIPTTEDEKKAAAAWQESAEYMNKFRQILAAQGFRSIPAYDNMLSLRGQLWQDKSILNKTLDDSISLLDKNLVGKHKLLGDTKSDQPGATNDPKNPGGLAF